MRRTVLVLVLALVALAQGCISKSEVRADARAWRAYMTATVPDLETLYGGTREPSRSMRLKTIRDAEAALRAFEVRAGIAEVAS